jgi:4-diphosphocytidyl-2-C-methyl-D-erythritol kinase
MPDVQRPMLARTFPPAKLNLFLELLGRREDGFHEIDTVMVPIDWRDELQVRVTDRDEIRLQVEWRPSIEAIADQLGIELGSEAAATLLSLPTDNTNLVCRALDRFRQTFGTPGGFEAKLLKQIPAGAGMGGASSDAASALRCAAKLHGLALDDPQLTALAAEIGSDVPFFMGLHGEQPVGAARGTGRGERLQPLAIRRALDAVVVFPAVSLSTGKVYSFAQIPSQPQHPDRMIEGLKHGNPAEIAGEWVNRLSEPAKKLAPRIGEILESLWHSGLRMCQMTGSGSACFALANSSEHADQLASYVRSDLQPGALVRSVRTVTVPAAIEMISLDET